MLEKVSRASLSNSQEALNLLRQPVISFNIDLYFSSGAPNAANLQPKRMVNYALYEDKETIYVATLPETPQKF